MEKVRYMISDAANIVNVESHVLRYWEDELELDIPRNEMGHRYYTKENIQEFQRIKELKEQGYQLKAIRMIVHNGSLDGQTAEAVGADKAPDLRQIPSQQSAETGQAKELHQNHAGAKGLEQQEPVLASKQEENAKHVIMVKKQGNARMPQVHETQQSILDNTDKMAQFTDLMTQIVGKAISANNNELSRNISEDVGEQVMKELNYLMREREEAEEERFRKLDAAIRGNLKKKETGKRRWKKKKLTGEPEGV